ncbi:MAG: heme-binding protein [Candidatus Binataceae bacterium]
MPYATLISSLADFQQQLVGTWENQDFGVDEHGNPVGGKVNPLSYNIMPLPQHADPDGYILKNFKYYETIRFNDNNSDHTIAIAAEAPNRGGLVSQNARALFYEQQVKFAEGPAHNDVVHVENGAWLWLPRFVQQTGPYPANIDQEAVSDALEQPADIMVAKQIAVPHGNSILALGTFDTVPESRGTGVCKKNSRINGRPVIPDAPFPYPTPEIPVANLPPPPTLRSILNVDKRYTTLRNNLNDYQNPHPELTQCPNKPLQQAVAIIEPDSYMHWYVTTEQLQHGKGTVTNIPFERRVSEVTDYIADYWLLFKEKAGKTLKYLTYTQTILMRLKILDKSTNELEKYAFPHITCNTVTYQSGS